MVGYTNLARENIMIAYQCPECGQSWTVFDDPEEWAYGHDCEA